MKIILVGGRKKMDFLAKSLMNKKHEIVMINDDEAFCKYLSKTHGVPVYFGDGSKPYILSDANIKGADVIIALTPSDADNLVICQIASEIYKVKRAFAAVNNPKNVDVFKKLGIHSVVSSTYIVSMMIEQMASVESIESYFSIDQGKIAVMEVIVQKNSTLVGKRLEKIAFPKEGIIGCVIRGLESFIPRGQTILEIGDKLVVLASFEAQTKIIELITGGASR